MPCSSSETFKTTSSLSPPVHLPRMYSNGGNDVCAFTSKSGTDSSSTFQCNVVQYVCRVGTTRARTSTTLLRDPRCLEEMWRNREFRPLQWGPTLPFKSWLMTVTLGWVFLISDAAFFLLDHRDIPIFVASTILSSLMHRYDNIFLYHDGPYRLLSAQSHIYRIPGNSLLFYP